MALRYELTGRATIADDPVYPDVNALKRDAIAILDQVTSLRLEQGNPFDRRRLRSLEQINERALRLAESTANDLAQWQDYMR